jgi:hypothetical protein
VKIYWTSIEYKYLKGSINFGKFEGGFVYAFVRATDVRDALTKFSSEIESLNLGITNIEFISPYDDIPWETEEEQDKYDSLANEALTTKNVICDKFFAYKDE